MLGAAAVRQHIEWKASCHELRREYADRMLGALDAGEPADYQALLHQAMFREPPAVVYHTAPQFARERIEREGLLTCQPGEGGSWAPQRAVCVMLQGAQPPGVYVGAEPDTRGVWAHWPDWDVWAIDRGDLPWGHDELNPGCWRLDAPVPPSRLTLTFATIGRYSSLTATHDAPGGATR